MSFSQENGSTIPTKIFKNCQWISKSQSVSKKKSPHYPCRRWGHTAVLHDKYMYVFSGCGRSDNQRQWEQIYRMDCLTFSWERLNSPSQNHPSGRDSHTCVCIGNQLYFFGGSCNETMLGDFWCFDIETYEWREIPTVAELSAREGHSMVALSDRIIYISGGWDSVQNVMTDSHWLFDIQTQKFVQITTFQGDEMQKIESHSANLINESVYVFGGQGQMSGKTNVFYKDLYKLEFETAAQLHQKFDQWNELQNEEENKDSAMQIQPQEISIKIEKIKPNSLSYPSPRASHSAVVYADRFLFVIGGEGYQNDQIKDNEQDILIEQEQDIQGLEEEEKPIYPKNDIWIFETIMRTWSKLIPKSKQPLFQPRFSHSCIVFKDQLIIFGGLRSMGDVLEDIMVLHLKDSENHLQKFQRDEMKNICKYCQLIYGIQVEEDIQYQKLVDSQFIKQPKISLSFINGITSLIQFPFSCFGLFIDNAKLIQANEIKFELTMQSRLKVYQNSVDDQANEKLPVLLIQENDPNEFDNIEFQDLLFNFDIPEKRVCLTKGDQDLISKNGSAAIELQLQDQMRVNKRLYALNLKMASLRLGETLLICCKYKNVYNVGLVSTNKLINPMQDTLTIFYYQMIINEKERKVDSSENRYVLLNAISHLFTEEDFIIQEKQNYTKIFIFDLQKLTNGNQYELLKYNEDIINQQFYAYGNNITEASKLPDYSLKEYLQIYQIGKFPCKININGQYITNAQSCVNKIDNKYTIEMKDDTILKKFYDCTESYTVVRLPINNYGIYLYYNGRLVNRYKVPLGVKTKQHIFSGFINVREFLRPNIIYEGFENSYLSSILYQLIDQMVDPNEIIEPEIRKEVKI